MVCLQTALDIQRTLRHSYSKCCAPIPSIYAKKGGGRSVVVDGGGSGGGELYSGISDTGRSSWPMNYMIAIL